jgi:hypothetical protein
MIQLQIHGQLTVGTIPNEYLTSDSGAFTSADKTKIYVVGGYNQMYFNPDSLSTTFMFDTTALKNTVLQNQNANIAGDPTTTRTDLIVTKMADLNNPRGDIHAVTVTTTTSVNGNKINKAYVAGGFTAMCQPLKVRTFVNNTIQYNAIQ